MSVENVANLCKAIRDVGAHFDMATPDIDFFSDSSNNDSIIDVYLYNVRSYVALCHGELEHYFEESAKCIVDESLARWNSSRKTSLPLLALCAHYSFDERQDRDTNYKINRIVSKFRDAVIKRNNGIKRDDIMKLFIPLGLDRSEIEELRTPFQTLMDALDSFGEMRGLIVHASHSAFKAQRALNYRDMKRSVEEIVAGIFEFDRLVADIFGELGDE